MSRPLDLGPVDRLAALAETLAGSWGARARNCTTAGQERAILRMFGATGLDRDGQPLAAEILDRYTEGRPDRLAGGLALPFAAALVEYDATPQELALDIASGAVDLALEAEVLRDPGRRAAAEQAAHRLAAAALERIDANRTARLELLGVIGDADRPWVGAALTATDLGHAAREATSLVGAGFDVLQVSVPAFRELAERLFSEGVEVPFWRPRPVAGAVAPVQADEPPPSGSQRGLAALRQTVDAAAAERRSYARLATIALPLSAPEQALVAAFERIDVVHMDAMAEIVEGEVDPDRGLADHAFAHRLLARSGSTVVVGAGPLVVAPDLARGVPSDSVTRAGRALALQLIGVALALRDGVPAARLLVGAFPSWIGDEDDPAATAIAQVAVRRALLGAHPLVFEEPAVGSGAAGSGGAAARWPSILSAVLPLATPAGLVVRATAGKATADVVAATRAWATVAAEMAGSLGPLEPRGLALEIAQGTVAAAVVALERLAATGWPSILGQSLARTGQGRLGADAVVERTETFDPFAAPGGIAGLA
jgi:hypothetical protein